MRITRSLVATTLLAASAAHAQKWIDAKTGKTVPSGPIVGHVEVTGSKPEPSGAGPTGYREYQTFGRPTGDWVQVAIRPDASDPDHAFDPESDRNFVFDHDRGEWLDAKTGEIVPSGPIVGHIEVTGSKPEPSGAGPTGYREYQSFGRPTGDWVQVAIRPDAVDHNRAFDPQSARNFVRVDVPTEKPKTTNETANNEHASVTPTQPLKPFDQRILDLQNAERTALGLPPFNWNPTLAQNAQGYANQLATTGQLAHAPREGRGDERENLNQGMLGWGPDQMARNWLDEKRHFIGGTFPNISDTGNWYDVGHYSQIVWPTTTDVGCGEATGSGFQWLVCRYGPGGNKDGQAVGFPAHPVEQPTIASDETFKPADTSGGGVDRPYGFEGDINVGYDLGNYRIESEVGYRSVPGSGTDRSGFHDPAFLAAPDSCFTGQIYWDPVQGCTVGGGVLYFDLPNLNPKLAEPRSGESNDIAFQDIGQVDSSTPPLLSGFGTIGTAGYQGVFNADSVGDALYGPLLGGDEANVAGDRLWFWGSGNRNKVEGSDEPLIDTKVETPTLPTREVFNGSNPTPPRQPTTPADSCAATTTCKANDYPSWGSSDEAIRIWGADELQLREAAHQLAVAQAAGDKAAFSDAREKGLHTVEAAKQLLDRLHEPGHGGQMVSQATIDGWARTLGDYETRFASATAGGPATKAVIPEQVYALQLQGESAASLGDLEALTKNAHEAREIADGAKSGTITFIDPKYAEQVAVYLEGLVKQLTPAETKVEQPKLPNTEPFKTPEPKPGDLDPH